jgi:hypothetical protein
VLRCDASAGCFALVDTCPSADACVIAPGAVDTAFCARSRADCPRIARAYQATVAAASLPAVPPGSSGLAPGVYNPGCAPADCAVVPGHCDLGLGACWYLGRPQPQLDRLAALYASLGCATPTPCACPPAQVSASCEANPDGGEWVVSPGITATNACLVR